MIEIHWGLWMLIVAAAMALGGVIGMIFMGISSSYFKNEIERLKKEKATLQGKYNLLLEDFKKEMRK